MADKFPKDIKACGSGIPGFVNCVQTKFKQLSPDVVVRGHAVYRLYGEEVWNQLDQPITNCLKKGTCINPDVKSFYLDPKDNKGWAEYEIGPNHYTVVGQQPELWEKPSPMKTGQVLVGKYKTMPVQESNSGVGITEGVARFIDRSKNVHKRRVMYLGIGFKLRPEEADIDNGLSPLRRFIDYQVSANNDWDYILFHSAKKPDNIRSRDDSPSCVAGNSTIVPRGMTGCDEPTTHGGRVYHVWYGENSNLNLFKRVDLSLHHCGAGTISDAIAGGAPQMGIPISPGPPDQVQFARKMEQLQIGAAVPPLDLDKASQYKTGPMISSFNRVISQYGMMQKNVQTLQHSTNLLLGASNAVEMMIRTGLAMLQRIEKGVKLPILSARMIKEKTGDEWAG
jgi:hypothetical protein